MEERGGVRVGMEVRDADGKRLGKVSRCGAWAFEVTRGFWDPRQWTVGYLEVLALEDGAVVVARSDEALFELAAGHLPKAWQRPLPRIPPVDGDRRLPQAHGEGERGEASAPSGPGDRRH